MIYASRTLDAGSVIRKAWELYTAHWWHLVSIALAVYVLISLVAILLTLVLGWFGILLGSLLSLAGIFWLQGALVIAIDDVRDGRADLGIRQTLERVTPRLTDLTLAGLLAGVAIGIGLLLLIVPGLYLLTIWLVIVPAIMLENCGRHGLLREESGARPWLRLVRVRRHRAHLADLHRREHRRRRSARNAVGGDWAGFVVNIIGEAITAPFLALAWTITYYELRDLKGAEPTAAV